MKRWAGRSNFNWRVLVWLAAAIGAITWLVTGPPPGPSQADLAALRDQQEYDDWETACDAVKRADGVTPKDFDLAWPHKAAHAALQELYDVTCDRQYWRRTPAQRQPQQR